TGWLWAPLGIVANSISTTNALNDKDMLAIDTTRGAHAGRMYVIWDFNNTEKVAFSDDGVTWTQRTLDANQTSIGGNLSIGSDGTVFAVWNRLQLVLGAQTGETTVVSRSADGGNTWSTPVAVASHRLLSFGGNNAPPAQDVRGVNAFPSIGV